MKKKLLTAAGLLGELLLCLLRWNDDNAAVVVTDFPDDVDVVAIVATDVVDILADDKGGNFIGMDVEVEVIFDFLLTLLGPQVSMLLLSFLLFLLFTQVKEFVVFVCENPGDFICNSV